MFNPADIILPSIQRLSSGFVISKGIINRTDIFDQCQEMKCLLCPEFLLLSDNQIPAQQNVVGIFQPYSICQFLILPAKYTFVQIRQEHNLNIIFYFPALI